MSNGEFPNIIHNPACTKAVSLVFTLLLCLHNEHLSIDKKDCYRKILLLNPCHKAT